jgi:uracil-DNA glycosylase
MARGGRQAMMERGAQCKRCALRSVGQPVPMETHGTRDVAVIVAQAPGKDEVEEGRPLCGKSGMELERALNGIGVTRQTLALTNAAACRFPNDDVKAMLDQIARRNKADKVKPGDEGYMPTPFEACYPRLEYDIAKFQHRIALGGYAAQALIPERKDAKILGIRGHKYTVPTANGDAKVFPTVNPAFVMRARRWSHVMRKDLRTALDWFAGKDDWVEPIFLNARYDADGLLERNAEGHAKFRVPTVREIKAYLRGKGAWKMRPRWMVYDTETDGIRTDRLNLRCFGIGGVDHVLIIPFLSVDGIRRFYSAEDEHEIVEAIRVWAADETILKIGHNAGSFDREVLEYAWGITPTPLMDTVLLHKGVDAELPHTLDFVGSYYTSIHAWKEGKDNGWNAKTDAELWLYCGYDVVVNARCVEPLVREAFAKKQITSRIPPVAQLSANVSRDPVTRDHAMQAMGVQLKRVGMPVLQGVRAEKEKEALQKLQKWKQRCHALLTATNVPRSALGDAGIRAMPDDEDLEAEESLDEALDTFEAFNDAANAIGMELDDFNPGSHHQVRRLIEKVWDLPEPMGLGKTAMRTGAMGDGDLRTGKAVLQAYMTDRRITEQQRAFFHSVFMYRKWAKAYGSEVRPSRFDLDAIRAQAMGHRYKGPKLPRCSLREDGRIHANWSAHGTLVGRWATSGPNVQNLSLWFKACIGPLEDSGHVLVGADVEGIHLRIIAELWGVPSLVEAFEKGYDAHSLRAERVLGDMYRKAAGYTGYGKKPEKKTLAAKLRDMVKTLTYAGAYGGEPATIYRVMRSAVDEEGRLQMPDLRVEQVEVMHDNWMREEPEWERAWNRNIARVKKNGFIATPILGRRRYFLDGNENDMRNYEILATEGDIMGEVTQRFVDAVPFEYAGTNTGLINQCHDALYAQVPRRDAERVRGIMREIMNAAYGGIQLRAGNVDVGMHMAEVAT